MRFPQADIFLYSAASIKIESPSATRLETALGLWYVLVGPTNQVLKFKKWNQDQDDNTVTFHIGIFKDLSLVQTGHIKTIEAA